VIQLHVYAQELVPVSDRKLLISHLVDRLTSLDSSNAEKSLVDDVVDGDNPSSACRTTDHSSSSDSFASQCEWV